MELKFESLKSVGIVGIGQIGGSIGIVLRNRMRDAVIYGCDINSEILENAYFLDFKTEKIEDLLECNLIILSVPIFEIIRILEKLDEMNYKGIVIDTGSTKKIICDKAKSLNIKFVGGHPLAGNEKIAPYAWDEKLFDNRRFFLCDVKKNKKLIKIAEEFVKTLGSSPLLIDPDYHDKVLALTSHLPYLISVLFLKNSKDKKFEGPAFKSFTRIAHQNPEMFADIILTNKKNIKKIFKEIEKEIKLIFEIDDKDTLIGVLNENKKM